MKSRRFVLGSGGAGCLGVRGGRLAHGRARADDTVLIPCVCELSGAGAVSGTNYRDGAHLAIDEINAKGGILGKKIEMPDYDTQTDPQTSRALMQKAVDGGAYADHGHGLFGFDDRQHDRRPAGRRAAVHRIGGAEHHRARATRSSSAPPPARKRACRR